MDLSFLPDLDVARENSDFEAGGSGREEAVVGMPIQSRDGGLDGLLDVFRHPPIVFLEIRDKIFKTASWRIEPMITLCIFKPYFWQGWDLQPL